MIIKPVSPDYWAKFNLFAFEFYLVEGALFKNCYDPIFTVGCFEALYQHANSDRLGELARSYFPKIEDENESMACYALQDTAICWAFLEWLCYRAEQNKSVAYGVRHLRIYWENSIKQPDNTAFLSLLSAARHIIALKSGLQQDKPTRAHFKQLFSTHLYMYENSQDYKNMVDKQYERNLSPAKKSEFTHTINQAIDILQDLEQLDIPTATRVEQPQIPHAASDGAQGQMPIFYE